jgi:hypothetical protein
MVKVPIDYNKMTPGALREVIEEIKEYLRNYYKHVGE